MSPSGPTSRNLWIIAITRSEESVASSSFSFLMLSATFTEKPMLWLVSESWSSSWVRSVTKTTFHFEREGCRYISRTMNIMVRDFPEPCVCQMMPLRSRGVLPFQQPLHGELDSAELAGSARRS